MSNPLDNTIGAGQIPFNSGIVVGGQSEAERSNPGLWNLLKRFFQETFIYTIPRPFSSFYCWEITLVAVADFWIDERNYINPRRGFAVVNFNTVAGQDIWINSNVMSLPGQGQRILANGGTFYAPVSSNAQGRQVHIYPSVVPTVIGFTQFG